MKKSLIIAGITALMLSSTLAYADTQADKADPQKPLVKCKCDKQQPPKAHRPDRPNLDERLKLTEEQKAKAHELRMQGHEKIKPVIKKIKAKHEEIKKIAQSSLSQEKKDKKIAALKEDLKKLRQEARNIRTENTKAFESILTPEQKAEFEKIKEEARVKHQMMKNRKGPHKHGFNPKADGKNPVEQPKQNK